MKYSLLHEIGMEYVCGQEASTVQMRVDSLTQIAINVTDCCVYTRQLPAVIC